MTLGNGYIGAIAKYFVISRHAGRLEFLVCLAVATLMMFFAADSVSYSRMFKLPNTLGLGGLGNFFNWPLVAIPFFVISLILHVTVVIRRLRHLSFSSWWALMILGTQLGLTFLGYWYIIFLVSLLVLSKENESLFS